MIARLRRFLREFCRLFAERWPKGAILWSITALVFAVVGIALQVAVQLLRGPIKREGPRLDDLSPTGTNPGAIIPRPHGHTIAPGQVIAQTRIKETKKKNKQGGKSSPTVETTTYSYSIPAVAVAFSSRRIGDILRIKANEKVIFDRNDVFTLEGDEPTFNTFLRAIEWFMSRHFDEIEIFPGTETQAPSAILEAHEGVGNVPAYRGTAYFVLKELQLADFGNRMPAFKVEVAEIQGIKDPVITDGNSVAADVSTGDTIFDWENRRVYGQYDDASIGNESANLDIYNLDTLDYIETDALNLGGMAGMAFNGIDTDTGYLIGSHRETPLYYSYVYDPAVAGGQGALVTQVTNTEGHSTYDGWDRLLNEEDRPSVVLKHPISGAKAILSSTTLAVRVNDFDTLALQGEFRGPDGGASGDWAAAWLGQGPEGEARAFWANDGFGSGPNDEFRFYSYTIGSGGVVSETLIGTLDPADIHPDAVQINRLEGPNPMYDPTDDSWVFWVFTEEADATEREFVLKWTDDDGVVWSTEITGRLESTGGITRSYHRLNGGVWFYGVTFTNDYTEIRLSDGKRTDHDGLSIEAPFNGGAWDDQSDCLYQWKLTGQPDDQQILQRACFTFSIGETSIGLILRAAMTEWTPDVSPLIEGDHFDIDAALFADPFLVTGATFTQLMSPREVAEQCMTWKPCIFFEGGDTIRFKPRDGSKVATIRHQDMGQRGRSEEVKSTVITTRSDDAQLPREVRIKFLDQNRLFSANTAYARITRSRSSLVQESDLQFAGTPSEAKFAAWTAMGEAYAQRREMKASLPLKYFILEPSDVIELPDNDGNLIECRLAQAELGANWIIDVKANDHVNSHDGALGAEDGVSEQIPITQPLPPLTYALDLPRLTDDAELDDGFQLMLGLGGTYEAWKGGVIYRDTLSGGGETAFGEDFGDEETSFEEVGETNLGVDAGKTTTPPSGDVDEFTVDRLSTMRVTFDTALPDFASLSDGQFLTGLGNVFAVGNNADGWEIVQAQVATKVSDQVWDFSTLRRGLRGTEWAIGQAEAGDTVVRLETATLQRDAFAAGDIGQTITYRGVTFNMDVTTASDTDILVVGRGLIPYSPLLGEVYRDGAGEITGTVYARALQADDADLYFVAGADFEIDIKDAPGGTVLRTLELTDTGDFTYTAADQTTDFGDTETTVDAELFQLDDDGDRGYGREVIL